MTNKIDILYFASLSEALSRENESFEFDESSLSVAELKSRLSQRGHIWQEQINNSKTRSAVNQTIAKDHTLIQPNDEVAFFPPVTGG